jgi:hypothetical protein
MAGVYPSIDNYIGGIYSYEEAKVIDSILRKQPTHPFQSFYWKVVGRPNSFFYFNTGGG